jgi:hypothetical protein
LLHADGQTDMTRLIVAFAILRKRLKMNLKRVKWESIDKTHLVPNREMYWAFVNAVIKLKLHKTGGGEGLEFVDRLSSSQFLEKDCAPRSYLCN